MDYNVLIEKIALGSGLRKEDVEQRIDAKKAKLSGLISREGAALIVASELSVNLESQIYKISQLANGMRKANVTAKIIEIGTPREFNKNGRQGKVCSMTVADDTGNIRTVLWDANHIGLVEKGELNVGDAVDIRGGSVKNSELHLGSFSEIKKSSEKLENVKMEKVILEKKISELVPGDMASVRAFVVQAFEPRFFEVCPECGKRAVQDGEGFACATHGKVAANKRALMNMVLDDGTDNIRAVVFSEQIEKLIAGASTDREIFAAKKAELLGKEGYFEGSLRMNKLFNNPEFFVNSIKDVNIDELIKKLEKK